MKAILFIRYGSPDSLKFGEIPKPTPAENEVLIRVHAASINPMDWHIMRGSPYLARLSFGLFKPKITTLGADVAGVVEHVGSDVSDFKPGDEVFGAPLSTKLGSLAEYMCIDERGLIAKPKNISFEEAAAVPVAAITALQSLQHGRLHAGQHILVNGASGGVGTYTVQIAKALGAKVTGVCSGRNADLVRSLGADHVIDYTQEDFTKGNQKYDLLIDNIGNHGVSALRKALSPTGRCTIVGYTSPGLLIQHFLATLSTLWKKQKIGVMNTAQIKHKDMMTIKDLLESGEIKSVIDKRYKLNEVPQAIRYLETKRARGKVVIKVL